MHIITARVKSLGLSFLVGIGCVTLANSSNANNLEPTSSIQVDIEIYRISRGASLRLDIKPERIQRPIREDLQNSSILTEPRARMFRRLIEAQDQGFEQIASPGLLTSNGDTAFLQTGDWQIQATPNVARDDYTIHSELEITRLTDRSEPNAWKMSTSLTVWDGQSVVLGTTPNITTASSPKEQPTPKTEGERPSSPIMALVTLNLVSPAGDKPVVPGEGRAQAQRKGRPNQNAQTGETESAKPADSAEGVQLFRISELSVSHPLEESIKPQELSRNTGRTIHEKAIRLLKTSNFNSKDHPDAFPRGTQAVNNRYRTTLSGRYLVLTFPESRHFELIRGEVDAVQIIIGLNHSRFAETLFTIDPRGCVVQHKKYAGDIAVDLLNLVQKQ